MPSLSRHLLTPLVLLAVTMPVPGEEWSPWPWVNQAARNAGSNGGEGGQIVTAIEISRDGQTIFTGTDVGGAHRSTNGGASFRPCNNTCGANGIVSFAIDPKNKNRVLRIGGNSGPDDQNGIYLSTDLGTSWSFRQSVYIASGTLDYHDNQVVWDENSYDATIGGCKIAYWSRPAKAYSPYGNPEVSPKLYRSTDGGWTWSVVNGAATFGGANLATHASQNRLYLANENGFYISYDQGVSFYQKLWKSCRDVCVIHTQANSVWVSARDGIYRSTDAGENFSQISWSNAGGLPDHAVFKVSVNPNNPSKILVCTTPDNAQWYDYYTYISHDGGASWSGLNLQNQNFSLYPLGVRHSPVTWDPSNVNNAWIQFGDQLFRTTDGGSTFKWANEGRTQVMGDVPNFSAINPDVCTVATQDYSTAFTTNAGSTWTWTDPAATSWGGNTYGAYTADGVTVVVGHTPDWGGTPSVYVSWNSGVNFYQMIDAGSFGGEKRAYGSPIDKNILFFGRYRSANNGGNWVWMNDCEAVYTHNPSGSKELFGKSGTWVVRSSDGGASWQYVANLGFNVQDVAYDQVRNRVYAASYRDGGAFAYVDLSSGTKVDLIGRIPADQKGSRNITTVAVDPVDPSIVYAGGWHGAYISSVSCVRSTDAGATWQNLSDGSKGDGGYEVIGIRVNAKDRNAYITTMCQGLHKIGLPGPAAENVSFTSVPTSVAQSGTITVSVGYQANQQRDLLVDIFDNTWTWKGGARIENLNGSGTANAQVSYSGLTSDTARISVKLITDGGTYQNLVKEVSRVDIPVALPAPSDPNIAPGKTVTADVAIANYPASNAIDNTTGTRWIASDGANGHWLKVDLGTRYDLSAVQMAWDHLTYQYKVETSGDNSTWTVVVDRSATGKKGTMIQENFSKTNVRHVRLTYLGVEGGNWALADELRIYGKASPADFEVKAWTASTTGGGGDGIGVSSGWGLGDVEAGEWAQFTAVDLKTGYNDFGVSVATAVSSSFEVRIDSATGALLGTMATVSTGGWGTFAWTGGGLDATKAKGVHNVYLVGKTGSVNIQTMWFKNK